MSKPEFVARIKAAVAARQRLDSDIVIIARSDALQGHGFDEAVSRLKAAVAAGADVALLEGPRSVEEMRDFVEVMVRFSFLSYLLPKSIWRSLGT